MSPRALLLTGLGLLFVGLLVVPDVTTDDIDISLRAFAVQGYVSSACLLLGVALIFAASLISGLAKQGQRPQTPPPGIDHYS